MNVIQVISSSRTSGAERHVVLLSHELQRRGHSVTVVCPRGGWLPGRLAEACIPTVETPMHGPLSPATILRLRRLVRSGAHDVVHAHLTRATYMAYFASHLANVPLVSTVHVLTRDFAYRHLPGVRHEFVAVSDHIRRSLVCRGFPAERVSTVYNGTDVGARPQVGIHDALKARNEFNLPADALVVGVFGRIDAFKGQHILVKAAPAIVAAHPSTYFLLVGAARPRTQQALWNLADAGGVSQRVRFAGVRNDVPRLMAACDIVALPSVSEACSMVLIEAMASGRPVVATCAGGTPEIVADGVTGLLVKRDPAEVAYAVCALLADEALRASMASAGRARALARFDSGQMAEAVEGVYCRALGVQ